MTTLTRSNSRATGAPPCYKDYMNFLGNYKNGKSENFALTNNDSSSSVNSDVTDFSKPAVSFNAYIENLKNKKFNTVDLNLESKENSVEKPDFPKSQSVSVPKNPQIEEKVSKKSEIFIEVQPTKPVSEVSKMFEKKQNKAPTKSTKMNSKINIFEKQISHEKPKLAEKPILPKIETETQKVMSTRAQPSSPPPPTQKVTSARAQPINGPSSPPLPPPPTQKVTPQRVQPINVPSSPPPPPPPTQNVMPSRAQPINDTSSPPLPPPPTHQMNNGSSPPPVAQNGPSLPPPPPPLPAPAKMHVMNTLPKMQATLVKGPQIKHSITNPNGIVSEEIDRSNPAKMQATLVKGPQIKHSVTNPNGVVPEETDRSNPMLNAAPAKMQATLIKGPQIKHSVTNPDGVIPEEIDRNNPMVRKLVYGTLREMVGAYHDKANDIMATLPKNMVKKSNGVQDIIEKIASNGDLEKLNGRVNPKVEQE